MIELNPLNHPICFMTPNRLTHSAWQEHIPFAMFLVDILRPKMIVELGTQYGDSYCAFCQAVKELNLDTRCYAIDTWQGDPHSGFYGSEVLSDLLINEILAVGDESFQKKSGKALQDLIKGGVTTVYVSHNMDAIRKICNRAIWLEQGEIRAEGEAGLVVEEYLKAQGQA